jgi:hypothetical protein
MADHDGGPTISWPERYAVLLVCAYFGGVTALLWVMDHI